MPLPITDILLSTFHVDEPWLPYTIRGINKYCSGFRDIIIYYPSKSRGMKLPQGDNIRSVMYPTIDPANGYVEQMIAKLHVDEYTDADMIWHVDSDNIYGVATSPSDFISNGRCVIMGQEMDSPWIQGRNQFFQQENTTEIEFCRAYPFMYPHWLYKKLRTYCILKWQKTIAQYYNDCVLPWDKTAKDKDVTYAPADYDLLGSTAYLSYKPYFEFNIIDKSLPYYTGGIRQPVVPFRSYQDIETLKPYIEDAIENGTNEKNNRFVLRELRISLPDVKPIT